MLRLSSLEALSITTSLQTALTVEFTKTGAKYITGKNMKIYDMYIIADMFKKPLIYLKKITIYSTCQFFIVHNYHHSKFQVATSVSWQSGTLSAVLALWTPA